MRVVISLVVFGHLLAPGAVAAREADTRDYWVYEGGWFSTAKEGGWYEMNEESHRLGKPWAFKEVKRTKEYVELYDESRGVSLRLTEADVQARWDKDGKDAEWKSLYKGRWKKRG